MAQQRTIDERFNDSYLTDPRTLQPSTGRVTPTYNAKVQYYDPEKRRGGVSPELPVR